MHINTRDEQIAQSNQIILNNCTEIIKAIARDPEAEIHTIIDNMQRRNDARSRDIWGKHRENRDLCERYAKGNADALA